MRAVSGTSIDALLCNGRSRLVLNSLFIPSLANLDGTLMDIHYRAGQHDKVEKMFNNAELVDTVKLTLC